MLIQWFSQPLYIHIPPTQFEHFYVSNDLSNKYTKIVNKYLMHKKKLN